MACGCPAWRGSGSAAGVCGADEVGLAVLGIRAAEVAVELVLDEGAAGVPEVDADLVISGGDGDMTRPHGYLRDVPPPSTKQRSTMPYGSISPWSKPNSPSLHHSQGGRSRSLPLA